MYIQQAITSHLDYQHVLQRIVNEARELTASHRAVVFFLEDDELRAAAIAGEENPKALANYRMPVAGSLIGLAIELGSAVRINDARHDPHVMADPRRKALVERTGVQSLLIVPLLSNHRIIGAISLSDKLKGLYDERDEQILTLLASSAVIALENAIYCGACCSLHGLCGGILPVRCRCEFGQVANLVWTTGSIDNDHPGPPTACVLDDC